MVCDETNDPTALSAPRGVAPVCRRAVMQEPIDVAVIVNAQRTRRYHRGRRSAVSLACRLTSVVGCASCRS